MDLTSAPASVLLSPVTSSLPLGTPAPGGVLGFFTLLSEFLALLFLQALTLTLCLALFLDQKVGVPVLPYPPFCYLWLGPYFVFFFPGAEICNLIHLVTWLRENQTVPSALYTG